MNRNETHGDKAMRMIHEQLKDYETDKDDYIVKLMETNRKMQMSCENSGVALKEAEDRSAVAEAKVEEVREEARRESMKTKAVAEAEIESVKADAADEIDAILTEHEVEINKAHSLLNAATNTIADMEAASKKREDEYNNSTALTSVAMAELQRRVEAMDKVYSTAQRMVEAKLRGEVLEAMTKEVELMGLFSQDRIVEQKKPDKAVSIDYALSMGKSIIIGVVQKPQRSMNHHATGWINKWAELTDAVVITDAYTAEQLHKAKKVYVYGSINGKGSLWNIPSFEAMKGDIQHRFDELAKFIKGGGKAVQMDEDFQFATKPRDGIIADPVLNTIGVQLMQDLDGIKGLTIGDSHSISVAPKGYAVIRMDGKTLGGALHTKDADGNKVGLLGLIPANAPKNIRFSLGNIDIRHHICRDRTLEEAIAEADKLYTEYAIQYKKLVEKKYNVEIMEPMPNVSDDRIPPKSGWHLNTPYIGSEKDRDAVVDHIVSRLYAHKFVVKYPRKEFYCDGDKLNQKRMESTKSVHLAPHSYLSVLGEA